jgi:hypothetical protein
MRSPTRAKLNLNTLPYPRPLQYKFAPFRLVKLLSPNLPPHIPMTISCLTCKLRKCLAFAKSTPKGQRERLAWINQFCPRPTYPVGLHGACEIHLKGLDHLPMTRSGLMIRSSGKEAILSVSYLYMHHKIEQNSSNVCF